MQIISFESDSGRSRDGRLVPCNTLSFCARKRTFVAFALKLQKKRKLSKRDARSKWRMFSGRRDLACFRQEYFFVKPHSTKFHNKYNSLRGFGSIFFAETTLTVTETKCDGSIRRWRVLNVVTIISKLVFLKMFLFLLYTFLVFNHINRRCVPLEIVFRILPAVFHFFYHNPVRRFCTSWFFFSFHSLTQRRFRFKVIRPVRTSGRAASKKKTQSLTGFGLRSPLASTRPLSGAAFSVLNEKKQCTFGTGDDEVVATAIV